MQKRKYILLFTLLSFLTFLSLKPAYASGTEGQAEKSASVQTNGTITFTTENSTVGSTSDSTPTSSSTTDLPSTGGGKLPQTGESIQQGMTYGGIALLTLLLIFFVWKRQKNEQSRRDANQ